MSAKLEFDLCPETGIGCMLVRNDADVVKIDMMPDEADDLKQLVQAKDLQGAKTLLSGINKAAETALAGVGLEAFEQELI